MLINSKKLLRSLYLTEMFILDFSLAGNDTAAKKFTQEIKQRSHKSREFLRYNLFLSAGEYKQISVLHLDLCDLK